MFTAAFWRDAAERAIATAAQAALGVLGADSIGVLAVDLRGGLVTVGIATAVSVLKSLVAATGVVGDKGDASALTMGRHAA